MKGAIFEQGTRRGRKYLIVERLLKLKDALVDIAHQKVCFSEAQWKNVQTLLSVYCVFFPFHKKIANCSFDTWNILQGMEKLLFKFARISDVLADAMRKFMVRRKKTLLDNDVLLAAIMLIKRKGLPCPMTNKKEEKSFSSYRS